MTTDDMLAYTVEHGGGTFDAALMAPVEPATGYAVAKRHGSRRLTLAYAKRGGFGTVVRRMRRTYQPRYIGTWIEGGLVYVDCVSIVASLPAAIIMGTIEGQEAIYSFKEGKSIYLNRKEGL